MMSCYRGIFIVVLGLLVLSIVFLAQVTAMPLPQWLPSASQIPTERPLQMMQFPPVTPYQFRAADTMKILPAESFVDGSKLYGQHCANCHGQMTVSQRRGISFSQLSTAVAQQPRMKKLPKLPPKELHSITDALR